MLSGHALANDASGCASTNHQAPQNNRTTAASAVCGCRCRCRCRCYL